MAALESSGWLAFEEYGSYAGPPSKPEASEVGATSLLLRWEPPQHLGGSGFEVVGYEVRVRYGGDGDFSVHTADTATEETQHAVEHLSPDSWHEFAVAAITSAGVGAPSLPSRPVLTERAPRLLREVRAASKQLGATRDRLSRKRAELLQLASSGTMALRPSGSGNAAAASSSAAAVVLQPAEDEEEAVAGRPKATLSAAEAKHTRGERRKLERQVAALERRAAEQELALSALSEQQDSVDAERHAVLEDAAALWRDGDEEGEDGGGGEGGGQPRLYRDAPLANAAVGVSDTPYATHTGRSYYGHGGGPPATPASSSGWVAGRAMLAGGEPGSASFNAAGAGSQPRQRRREMAAQQQKRQQSLEAYARLFAAEDVAAEESYPPFHREEVRRQVHRALSLHVLTDGHESDERRHYFDLALNRVRSASTHNVFPRFADWELEQLVLLFGRFDADHDGVLEFNDFCRLMLLIGGRVNASYHEAQLLRMFKKVDLNGDHLLDLNEFLWMQAPRAGGGAAAGAPAAEEGSVHPHANALSASTPQWKPTTWAV